MINPYLILSASIFIAIMFLLLVLLVDLSRASKSIKASFTFVCLSLGLWIVSNGFADIDVDASLFWTRIAFASAALALGALVIFVLWFPERIYKKTVSLTALLTGVSLLVGGVSLTSNIVPEINFNQGYADVVPGKLYAVYVMYAMSMVFAALFILLKQLKKQTGLNKERVKYVLAGTAIAAGIALSTNLIIPLITGSNPLAIYGSFAMLFFISTVSYSIIRYRLFSVQIATARATAYILSGFTLGLVFVAFIYVLDETIFTQISNDSERRFFYAFSAVIIGFTFPTIKNFFDRVTKKIFLRDIYEPEIVLTKIAKIISSTRNGNSLFKSLTRELKNQMNLSFVSLYLLSPDEQKWQMRSHDGVNLAKDHQEVMQQILKNRHDVVISVEAVDQKINEDVALILQLKTSQQFVGYIAVGHKKNGVGFTSSDHEFLEAIANEVAIAAENYLRFEAIELFNETLQLRITDATRELRESNRKLRQLDASKDEFISMASHQLRTPLTSIKGYISMLLDEDLGEIKPEQRKALEEAFDSSQRMVYLIGDFLNLSRIQTGKFELERTPISLPSLLSEEIKQLRQSAKARHVTLMYDEPSNFPLLNIDETKIRQVMMNFIDNAIYYARPTGGEILIVLETNRDEVLFRVRDNGIGVPMQARKKLFSKFFRADNAKKARPDGTGIGLYMAKRVVVAHGGEIIFESKEGEGSEFGFRLPTK